MVPIRIIADTRSVVAYAMLIAMVLVLVLECVDVDEYQRVHAVLLVARLSKKTVLACASPNITTAVFIAFLRTVLNGHEVNVFVQVKDPDVWRERWLIVYVKALVFRARKHLIPPKAANIVDCKHW